MLPTINVFGSFGLTDEGDFNLSAMLLQQGSCQVY